MTDRFRVGDDIDSGMLVTEVLHGGMGTVYLARHPVNGMEMAIKSIAVDAMPTVREALEAEAHVLCALPRHPYVVSVIGFTWRRPPTLAMEIMHGGSLRRRLLDAADDDSQRLRWAAQICWGLAFLHQNGVIHGDLKPENVLLDEQLDARLSDFGLSRTREQASEGDRPVGTTGYIAPELYAGRSVSDGSDVYALGMLLRELLPNPIQSDGDLDRSALHKAVELAVAFDPIDRPSARCMAELLASLSDVPEPAQPVEDLSSVTNRAASLSRLGQHDAALEMYEAALKQHGDSRIVHGPDGGLTDVLRVNFATALRRAHQPERALRIALDALERTPDDWQAGIVVVTILFDLRRMAEGDERLRDLRRRHPGVSEVRTVALQRFAQDQDVAEMRKIALEFANDPALVPLNVNALGGFIATELKDFELAIEVFDVAVNRFPSDDRADINRAVALELSGDPQSAAIAYEEAARRHPASAYAHHMWARCLFCQARYSEASSAFHEARQLDPAAHFVRAHAPLIALAASPDRPGAREILEGAAKLICTSAGAIFR